MRVETVPNIHISISFSSSSANNLEVFFMFPQAKNKQENKGENTCLVLISHCTTAPLQQCIRTYCRLVLHTVEHTGMRPLLHQMMSLQLGSMPCNV